MNNKVLRGQVEAGAMEPAIGDIMPVEFDNEDPELKTKKASIAESLVCI
ncbi:MAG: hypothetical protein HYU74_00085 [Dechloromonas sp.]|nr:hypothetical protein [Dechloromonas sp.]